MVRKVESKTIKQADTAGNDPGGEFTIMSLRLDKNQHDRLRKLAFDRRQHMRDFIVQGIEMVLKAEKY